MTVAHFFIQLQGKTKRVFEGSDIYQKIWIKTGFMPFAMGINLCFLFYPFKIHVVSSKYKP